MMYIVQNAFTTVSSYLPLLGLPLEQYVVSSGEHVTFEPFIPALTGCKGSFTAVTATYKNWLIEGEEL